MDDVFARVRKVIVDKTGREEAEITMAASFQEDLRMDSLEVVELIMGFEDAFGISIPDEDAEGMRTVGDAVEYLNRKVVTT